MRWLDVSAASVVWLSALWLLGLALLCALAPATAARFLSQFARTPRAHFLEQALRFVAGLALCRHAGRMLYSEFFTLLGVVLIVSSVALMLLPWRWHQRFAAKVVPVVRRALWLYALAALGLGIFVLHALIAAA